MFGIFPFKLQAKLGWKTASHGGCWTRFGWLGFVLGSLGWLFGEISLFRWLKSLGFWRRAYPIVPSETNMALLLLRFTTDLRVPHPPQRLCLVHEEEFMQNFHGLLVPLWFISVSILNPRCLHLFCMYVFSSWVVNHTFPVFSVWGGGNNHSSRGFPDFQGQKSAEVQARSTLQRSQVGRVHVDVPPPGCCWMEICQDWLEKGCFSMGTSEGSKCWSFRTLVGTSGCLLDVFFRWQMKGRESWEISSWGDAWHLQSRLELNIGIKKPTSAQLPLAVVVQRSFGCGGMGRSHETTEVSHALKKD